MEVEGEDQCRGEGAEDNGDEQAGNEEAETETEAIDVREASRGLDFGFGANGIDQEVVGFGHVTGPYLALVGGAPGGSSGAGAVVEPGVGGGGVSGSWGSLGWS